MQKFLRFFVIAVLIGLGVWGWRVFFPSADRAVRSHLKALAQTASFNSNQGLVPRGLKVDRLPDYFTEQAVINLNARGFDPLTINGREEIQQYAVAAMKTLQSLKVEFLDINLVFDPDKQAVIANLTAKVTVSGDREFYVMELDVMLKKVKGKWRIYRVETVKTLAQAG